MELFDLRQPEDQQVCQYEFVGLDKWAPYFDSLEPLGLRCCVAQEGMHFHTKNALLLN